MYGYTIITDFSQVNLEKKVIFHLKNGWTLAGGLSMVVVEDNEDNGKLKVLYGQSLAR
jgi:hypothetical protein